MKTGKTECPGALSSQLSYKEAVPLVLSAAKEYFNASAELTDSSMELARYKVQMTIQ